MRRFVLLVAGLALLAGVAATVSGGATQHQARWVIADLGTLGQEYGWAVAINERGQVIGNSLLKRGVSHAFVWGNGKMRDLRCRLFVPAALRVHRDLLFLGPFRCTPELVQ